MKISAAVLCGMLAAGCVQEDPQDGRRVTGVESEAVTVRCEVTAGTPTRSSIDADEDALEDINLYAYCDGKLEAMLYTQSPEDIRMKLYKGRTYNMYALANMGEVEAPVSEEDMKDHRYSVGSLREIEGAFPMAWMKEGFTVEGSSPSLGISLERLLARISFSIDRSELDDFQVTAIKLRQGALGVYPFREDSRAESASDVADGDWASASDLSTVNAGGEIVFYALENRQGVLMPGNSDPWSKTPDGIPDNSELCTYLEMTSSYSGQYQGVTVSSDKVTYRIYLGEDNCTDFNVERNRDMEIRLKVTEDRIFDEGWKVSYGGDLPDITYSLQCSRTSFSLTRGKTAILTALYTTRVNGTVSGARDVSSYAGWTSSNPAVATVSGGRITAVGSGSATITATYSGYKATCQVTVSDDVTHSLVLSATSVSVQAGSTTSVTASYVTYTNGTQTASTDVTSSAVWTTSSTSVATVSRGRITGAAVGTATVKASYSGLTVTCAVTVTAKPVTYSYDLAVSLSESSIYVGGTSSATATLTTYIDGVWASSRDVTPYATWSSSAASVASVSSGTVTGKAEGTASIRASYSGYSGSATITVTAKPVTYSYDLAVTPSILSLQEGGSGSFSAIYRTYIDGVLHSSSDVTSYATWSSSSSSTATVSKGTVTARSEGSATITATYNGYSDTGSVSVSSKPVSYTYELVVSPSSFSGTAGSTKSLTATYYTYADGSMVSSKDVTSSASWSSSSSSVASVSAGTVSLKSQGSVTITASYQGYSDSSSGTVSAKPVSYTYELVVSPSSFSGTTGGSASLSATYKTYADGSLESSEDVTSSATWTSSSPSVAAVSGGTVSYKAAGSVTITARYNGYSDTSSGTISAPARTLSSISASPSSVSGIVGDTFDISVTASYSDGSTEVVTSSASWSSSSTSVATVSGGTITAKSAGTASVTVSYGGKKAYVSVTVTQPSKKLTGLTLTSDKSSYVAGSNVYCTARASFSDGTSEDVTSDCSWECWDDCESTSTPGVFTAGGDESGSFEIYCSYTYEGVTKSASKTCDVTYPSAGISVSSTSAGWQAGSLSISISDPYNKGWTFTSDDGHFSMSGGSSGTGDATRTLTYDLTYSGGSYTVYVLIGSTRYSATITRKKAPSTTYSIDYWCYATLTDTANTGADSGPGKASVYFRLAEAAKQNMTVYDNFGNAYSIAKGSMQSSSKSLSFDYMPYDDLVPDFIYGSSISPSSVTEYDENKGILIYEYGFDY